MTYLTVPAACGSSSARILTMINRTIGIDLAIRGDHVAQIYDDGRPVGRPIRFRHEAGSLDAFMAQATAGLGSGDPILEMNGESYRRRAAARRQSAKVDGPHCLA
ncbi:DNA replication protein [Cereibacter sphaeroides]|uniref:DNA replication protein n=1 Tax=Cereibacter sphaeroides TaxID=1063 RepID=UPI001F32DA9C|nr:DNA replication protein [Cereibacter sphaeroides]MCE6967457.1 DNA replication protein [Cereibacter sphaeroides]